MKPFDITLLMTGCASLLSVFLSIINTVTRKDYSHSQKVKNVLLTFLAVITVWGILFIFAFAFKAESDILDLHPDNVDSKTFPVAESSELSQHISSSFSHGLSEQTSKEDDEKISSIKCWYNAFVDHMDDCRKSSIRDGWTAYWYEGDVAAVNYQSAVGPDGSYSESWYYHDGDLYFIYLRGANGDDRVLRLYYWEGKLIRWIEADGIAHNTDNDFYDGNYKNGMEYYWEAIAAG